MVDQLQKIPSKSAMRIPPQSIPAEACVLGSMLLSPDALAEAVAEVGPEWFYRPEHRVIFKALQEMADRDMPVDIPLLRDHLGTKLEGIGGTAYLADLVQGCPNASSISHYATIIKDKFTKRKLIQAANNIEAMGYDESVSATQLVGESYSIVQAAGEQQRTRRQVSAGDAMASMLAHAEAVRDGQVQASLPSGFPLLDELLTGGGFRPGNLILLAGGTGTGKSMIATDISRYMAQNGHGVLFVSAEMAADEIMERHAAAMTGIFAGRIAKGNISQHDVDTIRDCGVNNWHMEIIDAPLTIAEIAAEAKRLNSKWNDGLDCVVVDYLGLMQPDDTRVNREQQIGTMARHCKMYAQSMNIPWIVLHQLNREGTKGPPDLHHIRDSSQPANHANAVILLDWADEPPFDEPWSAGGEWRKLLIRVAKQRNGRTTGWGGAVQRKLRGHLTRTEPLLEM